MTKALGMTTDDGNVDHECILKVTREYTVVVLRNGRITESHQDVMIHGETEHSRWVEHHAGYQNHGPIAHAPDRRATGRKGDKKHKKGPRQRSARRTRGHVGYQQARAQRAPATPLGQMQRRPSQ